MNEVFEQIRTYINDHRQEMMDLWETLVNIDSGTANAEGVRCVAETLQKEMVCAGMQTKLIESGLAGPTLVAEWNKGAKAAPMALIGHMDTVFKDGTAALRPFRVDEEGHAHGPGVLDMKAGLVIALFAVKALQAAGFDKRPVKFIFSGDEENAHGLSDGADIIVEELKGCCCALNFETGYMDDGLVVARKGALMMDLTVKGVSAHSGNAPEKGRSAVLEMAQKIVELESKNDLQRGKLINCGVISGGTVANAIPGECKCTIGIRFPSIALRDEIIGEIQAVTEHSYVEGTTASLVMKGGIQCMEATDGVMKLFDHVQKTAELCGYGEVHSFAVGGGSDSGTAVTSGIPTVCAMGVRGEGNHTDREFAVVSSLFDRAVLAASCIYTYEEE